MNAAGINYHMRRRETHIDETALQHLLLNETVWKRAFREKENKSRWNILVGYLQLLYEKSRLNYIFPIILLFAYSLLGGLIFWSIESSQEEALLIDKALFIENLKREMLSTMMNIHDTLLHYNTIYANNTYVRNLHQRGYRKFALNQLYKSVYWYTLSIFYLTEHETHKSSSLRPINAEPNWKYHDTNFARIHSLKNYTDQLALRCWELGVEGSNDGWNEEKYMRKLNDSLTDFTTAVELNNVLTPIWTFWNAMFLAVTTYTTIGYGNITPKTKFGKLAAMVYAVIGIPLFLMLLHKLGRFFLLALEHIWDFVMKGAEYFSFVSSGSRLKVSEEEKIAEMPLLLALGVAFGWMFLCAAIFLRFEKDWDYFKSFYFFFCSLTTIGYGDVTPTNSEDMFLIFGLIIIGLSLVSMCINVIQLKLEKLFEELLLTLMEEYSSDPEANTLKGGQIGLMEMWRVWKRRKSRLRSLANARDKAGKASQHLAKVIPIGRPHLGRRHMLDELHKRLRQRERATQTDSIYPMFMPICEEAWTETSDIESSYSADNGHVLIITDASICGPSRCESKPVVVQSENSTCSSSSLQPTSVSVYSQPASLQSNPSKMYDYKRNTELLDLPIRVTLSPSSLSTVSSRHTGGMSVHSAPCNSPSRFPIDFDPTRRWTFVSSNRAIPGAPRGLAVPYMYTRNQSKVVHTTDMKRLMAELDSRLQDCRYLTTPASSICGSSSSGASVFK